VLHEPHRPDSLTHNADSRRFSARIVVYCVSARNLRHRAFTAMSPGSCQTKRYRAPPRPGSQSGMREVPGRSLHERLIGHTTTS
jgi:hypothetical protein